MISPDLVLEVSRTSVAEMISGYAVTIEHLIEVTTSGDWESGYYQLTPVAAGSIADHLNRSKPWQKILGELPSGAGQDVPRWGGRVVT